MVSKVQKDNWMEEEEWKKLQKKQKNLWKEKNGEILGFVVKIETFRHLHRLERTLINA